MIRGTGRARAVGLAVVPVLALGTPACTPDDPLPRHAGPLVGTRCEEAVTASLEAWGATRDAPMGAPMADGATAYRFPTGRIGGWVVLTLRVDGEPEVARIGPDATLRRRFLTDCRPVDEPRPALVADVQGPAEARLTDALLEEALGAASDRAGLVVYAWSPHMPLSVDGWREIAATADRLDLSALPTLIAHADTDFARREAARGGIPQQGLRVVSSVELVMRDLQVHAPSILVFSGERVSPVLPGYRNADGYRSFLEAFLRGD
jgi:hypothetical protein